jgi:DNA-binding Xre family transcriptional regulator
MQRRVHTLSATWPELGGDESKVFGVNAWHQRHMRSSVCGVKTNGLSIRRRRVELGHGMNRFAALAGISGAALSRIENGQRQPRPETLKKITDALGCQMFEVIAEEDAAALEVQSGATAAGNSDAAGVQPAAPNAQSAPTAK